jgi:hypothetical protein
MKNRDRNILFVVVASMVALFTPTFQNLMSGGAWLRVFQVNSFLSLVEFAAVAGAFFLLMKGMEEEYGTEFEPQNFVTTTAAASIAIVLVLLLTQQLFSHRPVSLPMMYTSAEPLLRRFFLAAGLQALILASISWYFSWAREYYGKAAEEQELRRRREYDQLLEDRYELERLRPVLEHLRGELAAARRNVTQPSGV